MEVASPLQFVPGQAGTKRPFACSPGHSPPHHTIDMDSTDDHYVQTTFKKRRFHNNKTADENIASPFHTSFFNSQTTPFFKNASLQHGKKTPLSQFNGNSAKRSRHDSHEGLNNASGSHQNTNHHQQEAVINDLKRVVDEQGAEIQTLKSDKANLESSLTQLKEAHDKAENENRILKKAVTIQQERQNHAASEIEAARQYKAHAEDRIQKLEQMNINLQYHLQASQHTNIPSNDFMGPRPPDVF